MPTRKLNFCDSENNTAYSCNAIMQIILFLGIGLSCWLTGCDETLQPHCIHYNIERCMIGGYYIPKRSCHYDCWDGYAKAMYPLITKSDPSTEETWEEIDPNNNHTCLLQVVNNDHNSTDALAKTMNKWPMDKHVTMYVSKVDGTCSDGRTAGTIALVGVIFLALSGLYVILFVLEYFDELKKERRNANMPVIVDDGIAMSHTSSANPFAVAPDYSQAAGYQCTQTSSYAQTPGYQYTQTSSYAQTPGYQYAQVPLAYAKSTNA